MRCWGWGPHDGISALTGRGRERERFLFTMWTNSQRQLSVSQEESRTQICCTQDAFLLFKPPSLWYFFKAARDITVLKITEIYSLTVLEAKVWNQGVNSVGFFWRLWGKICSLPFSWLLVADNNLWHPLACWHIMPISASIFTWSSCRSLCVFTWPSFLKIN